MKKQLQAVRKDIMRLGKTMEQLIKSVEREKPALSKRTAAKISRSPKMTKQDQAKKIRTETKRLKMTATDRVLAIVKRSRKGIDVPTLKTKSGFDDKKVRNIVFRMAKEGKIRKVGRGLYIRN